MLLGPRLPFPQVALLLPPWCLWAFVLTPLLLHFCRTHDPAGHSPLLAFALFLKCPSSLLHRIAPASLAGVCPPLERSPPPSSCCSSQAGSQWWVLRGGCHLPRLPGPSSDSSWYPCHGSGHQPGRTGRPDGGRTGRPVGGRTGTRSKNRQLMEGLNYILFSRERKCWSSVCLPACLSACSFSWVHHPELQGSRTSGSCEEPGCGHESNGRRHLTGWTAVPLVPLDCGQQLTGHS